MDANKGNGYLNYRLDETKINFLCFVARHCREVWRDTN